MWTDSFDSHFALEKTCKMWFTNDTLLKLDIDSEGVSQIGYQNAKDIQGPNMAESVIYCKKFHNSKMLKYSWQAICKTHGISCQAHSGRSHLNLHASGDLAKFEATTSDVSLLQLTCRTMPKSQG